MTKLLGTSLIPAFVGLCLLGCSTDENPITPDKMQELRKNESQGRANFNPNMSPPPAKK